MDENHLPLVSISGIVDHIFEHGFQVQLHDLFDEGGVFELFLTGNELRATSVVMIAKQPRPDQGRNQTHCLGAQTIDQIHTGLAHQNGPEIQNRLTRINFPIGQHQIKEDGKHRFAILVDGIEHGRIQKFGNELGSDAMQELIMDPERIPQKGDQERSLQRYG